MTVRGLFAMLMTAAAIAVIPQDAAAQDRNQRSGFWFSGGLGYGSLGCQNCEGREGSISGGLSRSLSENPVPTLKRVPTAGAPGWTWCAITGMTPRPRHSTARPSTSYWLSFRRIASAKAG